MHAMLTPIARSAAADSSAAGLATDDDVAVLIDGLTIKLPRGADRENAVENVTARLRHGKILCVVGESGSGKSISASALMGLLPAGLEVVGGRILLNGLDLLGMPSEALYDIRGRRIAMVFQEPMTALNPLMKIGEQIAEVFEAHGLLTPRERRARSLSLLEEVGLPDPARAAASYPFELSGGQRQRAMIAMALALEPQVLIADEPTTALDVTTQAQILKLIRELQQRRGMAVMFITHDFGVVAEIADYVSVMQHGRVVEEGAADDVLRCPRHTYTQRLLAAVPRFELSKLDRKGLGKDGPTVLSVEGLGKTYHKKVGLFSRATVVEAVKDVSFALARGETLGIVGESGSGKSSVGRCLVRLQDPDRGRVLLTGVDMASLKGEALRLARQRIQMIFQDPYGSLNPRIRVGRTIADGPIAYGEFEERALEQAASLLEMVGLDRSAANRFPHEFSGGQRQRIGIARALALRPEIIVADEAVSALDVSIQAQVLALLAQLKRELDLALIFITHDLRVAAEICDRVMVMQSGQVVELGETRQIFTAPAHPYTRSLIEAIPGTTRAAAFEPGAPVRSGGS
jgi:peptide/nickel transport system ATP-binding protein